VSLTYFFVHSLIAFIISVKNKSGGVCSFSGIDGLILYILDAGLFGLLLIFSYPITLNNFILNPFNVLS